MRLSLKIINNSDKVLHDVKPLLCFQYKDLAGFPRNYEENFRYTYVILDGRVTALSDVPTEEADATAKPPATSGRALVRIDGVAQTVEPLRFWRTPADAADACSIEWSIIGSLKEAEGSESIHGVCAGHSITE